MQAAEYVATRCGMTGVCAFKGPRAEQIAAVKVKVKVYRSPLIASERAHRHRMLDCGGGPEHATWLPGARLNIAACALSGPGGRAAITWADEESPAALRHVSLGDLRLRCFSVAAALLARGLAPGDWHSFICV